MANHLDIGRLLGEVVGAGLAGVVSGYRAAGGDPFPGAVACQRVTWNTGHIHKGMTGFVAQFDVVAHALAGHHANVVLCFLVGEDDPIVSLNPQKSVGGLAGSAIVLSPGGRPTASLTGATLGFPYQWFGLGPGAWECVAVLLAVAGGAAAVQPLAAAPFVLEVGIASYRAWPNT